MSEELKKLQIKFKAALTLLTVLVVCGFFIFSLFYLKEAALALQGNYNKNPITEGQLTIAEWNYLDEDFLNKEGDTWLGPNPLNMGGNSISNITTNPLNSTDAANVQYVLDAIVAGGMAGGGGVYSVWGEGAGACGAANELYTGYAFSAIYSSPSGGSNPVCIQSGDVGGVYVSDTGDQMYPLVTSVDSDNLPEGIDPDSMVKCAVCHNPTGTCYEGYGKWDCNAGAAGFSPMYDGFLLGSYGVGGVSIYSNPTQRACVSRNFDSSGPSPGGQLGAVWFGTSIENEFGLGLYTVGSSIKCAVCCN